MLNLVPKLVTEGRAIGRIAEELWGFDHFDGKVVDSSTEGGWNDISTGAGDEATLLADERGGVIQIDADSADPAVGGLAYERNWAPEQQGHRMLHEVKFKINTDLVTRYVFVGWNDDSGTAELPIILAASAAYGTVVAGDHCGVLFDTIGHATNVYAVGTNAGANVGTPIPLQITMAADRWVSFRAEIDSAGNLFASATLITDAAGATTDPDVITVELPLAVTPTVNMCPYFVFGRRGAANAAFYEADYSFFGGQVDAAAA